MIKQIPIDKITVGMYITAINNDWIPDSNLSQCGLIKQQSTVDKIRLLNVPALYIDTSKGADSPAAKPVGKAPTGNSAVKVDIPKPVVSLEKEREKAEKVAEETKQKITSAIDDVRNNKTIDVKGVSDSAEAMMESIANNQNALTCLSRIRHKDEYLLEHSVNVGVLMGIFSRALGANEKLQKELITGALLHDIGKILIPDSILNKPGKLDADEWEEMQRHVNYGERIFDATAGLSENSRLICSQHHERLDGSGYPRKLSEADISPYGRMAAIVDVYDAITSDRVYHKGMPPTEALKKLVEWSIFQLDHDLVYAFIRCVGVYPIGSLVQLSNKRTGVIIEIHPDAQDRPKLRLFYDAEKEREMIPKVFDLRLSQYRDIKIARILDPNQFPVDIRAFL